MKNLGELLKELRGKESLREASRRIGISHTYLDTIEKGVDKRSGSPVKPTPDTLKLISNAYSYDYEKLMKIAGYIEEDEIEATVNGKEITLTPEEFKVFEELKKYPVLFHDLASNPESKVKELIKLYKVKKMLDEDEEEYGDGFGELED